ncbi:outer membrane beta-barrel protein [Novosphingobium sp. BL-8H]|uniref:outer membrane protein n=1 Tax=Novosphingobium sp. BL-8H TaxID=3127640 RepID=UPI0037564B47
MKKITLAAAAAALFAMPAVANAQAYVQVTGGYDNASYFDDVNSDGFDYGAAAGYELPVSNALFVGVEATVAGSTGKKCYGDADTGRLCMKTGRDLAAVVRVGTNVGANSKLYVLAGYTNGRVTASYEDADMKMKASGNGDGLRLGAGFEQDLGHNMFGKIEYRYSNYEGGFSRNQALAGFGIKF